MVLCCLCFFFFFFFFIYHLPVHGISRTWRRFFSTRRYLLYVVFYFCLVLLFSSFVWSAHATPVLLMLGRTPTAFPHYMVKRLWIYIPFLDLALVLIIISIQSRHLLFTIFLCQLSVVAQHFSLVSCGFGHVLFLLFAFNISFFTLLRLGLFLALLALQWM